MLEPTDLEVAAGEVVALGGPNGAGKSTLLSILAGALRPSGAALAAGSQIGWMPQRPALYGRLTPRENLELFARLAGLADVGGPSTARSRRSGSTSRTGARPSSRSGTSSG